MSYDLFDREIFFIEFKPKKESDIDQIKEIILREISDLSENGIPDFELQRALKLAQVDYQDLLEDVQKQAYAIGKSFTATGDEQYPFTYCNYEKDDASNQVQSLLKEYFRPTLCHEGKIIQAPKSELGYLKKLQEDSDELDTKILFGKERTSDVVDGSYVHTINVEKLEKKQSPVAKKVTLKNGLQVLFHHNADVDLVECILSLKANHHHDPAGKHGIGYMVSKMMLEGSSAYPGSLFTQQAESYGISISSNPGQVLITMLSQDVSKGMELLGEIVKNATLSAESFDRIRSKTKSQLVQFWDTPTKCISQVASEKIYGNHPYGNMAWGSEQSLDSLTAQECLNYYKNMISPQEAILSIVGNFNPETLIESIENSLGSSWAGNLISDLDYPAILPVKKEEISIEKNRDQVAVVFAGLSVDRLDPLYDDLLVFNQILTGGMSSRLFDLREQSGLFYTIGGSVVSGSGKQPGMIFIKTIVSKDRLQEAQDAIANCLDSAVDTITDQEFDEAKEVVINTFPTLFDSNENMASTFLFLQKYELPENYFENRIDAIRAIDINRMKESVKKYLNSEKLVCVRIGRI